MRATRPAPSVSKAYVSWRSLASVLTAVRWREGAIHVQPISTRPCSGAMSPNRVDPTARPDARSTVAQATYSGRMASAR